MISSYLNLHKVQPILKRTRSSTKRVLGDHKLEFIKVEIRNENQISVYNLDGRRHAIQVTPGKEIVKVTCEDCSG